MERSTIQDILDSAAAKARAEIQQQFSLPPPQFQVPASCTTAPMAHLAAAASALIGRNKLNTKITPDCNNNSNTSGTASELEQSFLGARMNAQLVMMQKNYDMSLSLQEAIHKHRAHLQDQMAPGHLKTPGISSAPNGSATLAHNQSKRTLEIMGVNLKWLLETNQALFRCIQQDAQCLMRMQHPNQPLAKKNQYQQHASALLTSTTANYQNYKSSGAHTSAGNPTTGNQTAAPAGAQTNDGATAA